MSSFSKLANITLLSLAMTCSMTSCDYLDIVPPEQADLQDANKDRAGTLGFLYSCYAGVMNPMTYTGLEMGSDEYVLPRLWQNAGQKFNGIRTKQPTWLMVGDGGILPAYRSMSPVHERIALCTCHIRRGKSDHES